MKPVVPQVWQAGPADYCPTCNGTGVQTGNCPSCGGSGARTVKEEGNVSNCKRCGLRLDPLPGDVDRHPIGSCVVQLLGALDQARAEIERLREVERKALEQSEYIQKHGLTEWEMSLKDTQISKLSADLAEWREAAAKAAGENCPTDEQHCACVPLLRIENARLRAALEEIEFAVPGIDNYPDYCPWCLGDHKTGHAADCARQLALGVGD